MDQLASYINFKPTMPLCTSIDRWCGNGAGSARRYKSADGRTGEPGGIEEWGYGLEPSPRQ